VADSSRNVFLRFPGATVLLLIGLCVAGLWLARVEVDPEMGDLLAGDQRNLQSYQSARTALGYAVPVVVSLDCGEVFTTNGIGLIRDVTAALAKVGGGTTTNSIVNGATTNTWTTTNVISLTMNMVRPVITQKFPPVMNWVELVPERLDREGMAELRRWAQEHPFARNFLVAEDGRHTVLLVNFDRNLDTPAQQAAFAAELEAALEPFRQDGLTVRVLGLPLIEHEIRSTVMTDVRRFVPTALVVLLGVLFVTFRKTPRLMAFILANQILGIMLLPAVFQLTGLRLNIFTVLLVPLLTGIHLTLLVHVATSFQRAWLAGANAEEGVRVMWAEVFRASGFAALTTGIGLLALTASEVQQLREFGLLGAAGLAMLFGLTFGPGLAFLPVLFGKSGQRDDDSVPAGWSAGWAGWVRRREAWVSLAVVAGGAAIYGGIKQVRTDVRASEFLNARSPTRLMLEEMDVAYGGINVVQVAVDSGKTNGINGTKFLRYLDGLHRDTAAREGVSAVYSYSQLLGVINEVWEGGRAGTRHLPKSGYITKLFVGIIQSQTAQLPFLTTLCDTNFQTAQLTLRTREMPSGEYLALLRELETKARETAPEGVSVSAESGIRDILEADARIVRSQRRSVLWCAGLIAVVLAVLWRSVWLALLTVGVNALPVGMIIALQGFVGVPLNAVTIMVAAIALGIAMDDTIHFITHWRDERAKGASPAAAVAGALAVKGRPIVVTTVILAGMVGVFWVSSFPPAVHFGLLLAVGLAGALGAALVVLPAWLGLGRTRNARRSDGLG